MNIWRTTYFLSLCLLALFLASPGKAQDPYFRTYLPSDGLPTSLVYDAFQDSKGYMWFSTELGVSRFNGYEFENFTTEDGLADNEVFQVFEDSNQRIWFLSFNGKLSYYQDEQFHNADNNSILKEAETTSFLTCATEDEAGNLYFGSTASGIIQINRNEPARVLYQETDTIGFHYIWLEHGQFFTISSHKIYAFNSQGSAQLVKTLSVQDGYMARADSDQQHIYVAKYKDLFVFNKKNTHLWKLPKIKEINSEIIRLKFINGSFWLGTRDGVYQLTFEDDTFSNYSIRKFLEGKSITSILNDKEGNWWFSSLEAGVFFAPSIDIIRHQLNETLSNNKILCLSEDQDKRLWVGSIKNNYAILESDSIYPQHLIDNNNPGHQITNIRHFGKSETWIASKNKCLQIKNGRKRYLIRVSSDIQKDEFGHYWFAHRAISRYTSKELEPLLVDEHDPDFLQKEFMPQSKLFQRTILKTRTLCLEKTPGLMWAGTAIGLFGMRYDREQVYLLSEEPLIPYKIVDLKYDSIRQVLWVATGSNGVYAFQNDSIIYQINVNNGLSSNICNAINIDNKNAVWVGTALGFDKIIVHKNIAKALNFNSLYGLGQLKVNDIQSNNNKLYIATDEGLTVMPESTPISHHNTPTIFISGLSVNDHQTAISPDRKYPYYQNAMEFHFLGLSFQDKGNLTYQYRLYGLEDTWQSTRNRSMQYRSLPPGEYRFEVKAVNGKGRVSKQAAFIGFKIDAPIWQKPWFIILACAIVGLLLYGIWQIRLGEVKRKYELHQKLSVSENEKLELEKNFLELEMRALRQQMNPHFIYNALNTIKGYYAESKIREANSYISTFARVLRLILENNEKFIPLEKEMQLLKYYIELAQIRYPGKLNYHIEVDPNLSEDEVAIPPMLLQPFVENAIIHGLAPRPTGGHIYITFAKEEGVLISKVKDDGIGRLAAAKLKQHTSVHQSKAIVITKERLDIINKDYNITNALSIDDLPEGQGTEVIIKTPYTKLW
jgi:ligand-binding sensor domain-containing protein